jgi:hypothetical protein
MKQHRNVCSIDDVEDAGGRKVLRAMVTCWRAAPRPRPSYGRVS